MLDTSTDYIESITPNIISEEDRMPSASFALCFFQKGDTIQGVTHHEVVDNTISMGRYIDKDAVADWLGEITSQRGCSPKNEWIGEHILMDTPNELVFFQRSFIDRLWVRNASQHYAIRVPFPALLYRVNRLDRSLRVWALDRDSRPTPKSYVYHAPLMNIGITGTVCQGNAPIPDVLSKDCSKGVVEALMKSNFSHVNHSKTLKLPNNENVSTDDYIAFFKTLQSHIDFPTENLMPINKTINELFS